MADGRDSERDGGALRLTVQGAAVLLFGFHAWRYAGFLIDDAYISLRYARHWVDGHGLVFNPGEVVEGYTNFLWTVLGGGALWLGLDGMLVWQVVSALSTVAILGAVARLARLLGGGADERRLDVAPWIFLLGLEAFGYWATTGMETTFYTALFVWATVLCLEESLSGRRRGSVVLFVALALTRPEGVLVFALAHGLVWVLRERTPAALRRHVIDGLLFAVAYGLYFAWRYGFYGRPFPNTYYAKITAGPEQWTNGFINLKQWVLSSPVFAAALVLPSLLLISADRRRRVDRLTVAWGLCLAYVAYVVSVGGDFMPFFRFFFPVVPLLAVLIAVLLQEFVGGARRRVAVAAGLLALQALAGLVDEQSYRAFVAHRTTVVGQEVGRFFAELLPAGSWMGVNTVGSLPYESRLPTIDGLGLTDADIASHPVYVISPLWSGHRRGWGESMRRRRPEVILWYNSAGLREPHYLGDRQLADDPYFRFFYQRQQAVLPVRRGENVIEDQVSREPVLERFLGTPFGRPTAGRARARAPELGLSFAVEDGFLSRTLAHEADIEVVYFRLRDDAESLWPLIDEGTADRKAEVRAFVDRVAEAWRALPSPPVDPTAAAQVRALCEQVRQAMGRGDVDYAKEMLSRAARLNGQAREPLVFQYVANVAVGEKDLFLAVQAQREALRLDPGSELYRRNLEALLMTPYEDFTGAGRRESRAEAGGDEP